MDLDIQILRRLFRRDTIAILVEGFIPNKYKAFVERFQEHFKEYESPLCLDFLQAFEENHFQLRARMSVAANLFVYNLDLFGEGVDPDQATKEMCTMRSTQSESSMRGRKARQLMFARPEANLDYNGRLGYTHSDNHPLGNWCEFYRIEGGELVHKMHPIEHRD